MSSLSTTAGKPNPNSFERRVVRSCDIYRDEYVNDSFTGRTTVDSGKILDTNAEIFSGRVLKDFHRRRNSGELLPMTAYRKVSDTLEASSTPHILEAGAVIGGQNYRFVFTPSEPNVPCNKDIPAGSGVVDLDMSYIESRGIDPTRYVQNAAAKLYERGWDGATFMAELHKVVSMFRLSVPKLINIVKQWRQYKKNGGKLYTTIDAWLETRYGWRILLYDVQEISELIQNLDKKALDRTKERAGYDDSWSETESWSFGTEHKRLCEAYRTYNLQVRGSIIADFAPSKVLMNPALTAWELVTFSFIVDWFIHIGKAISAFSFVTLNADYTASYGYHLHRRSESSCTGIQYSGTWYGDGWSTFDEQSKIRVTEWFVRVPCEVPVAPFWNVNLNAFKVTDLLAILIKLFRKR